MSTVFITGANRGIGLEFCRQYAADGWSVIAACRNPGSASALKSIDGLAGIHALDVSDPAAIRAVAAGIDTPLDLVIANAGVYGPSSPRQSFGHLDPGAWMNTLQVNTVGTVLTIEALTPHLAPGARVVAISSRMGAIGEAAGDHFAYRSSKAALNMAMTLIAAELGPKGHPVATLHPGWVQTDMGGANASLTPQDSVTGLRRVIDGLKPQSKASFLSYDSTPISW